MFNKISQLAIKIGFPVCILLYIGFIAYNVKTNQSFFQASASDCITIGIAIIISYYLVQKRDDQRRQKDIIFELISKIMLIIENEKMYNFSGQTKEEIMMRNRNISNRIHILEKIKDDFSIVTEVDFIRAKFDEYCDFIGDNIEKPDYLQQSQNALLRPISLIHTKLEEIALNLYK